MPKDLISGMIQKWTWESCSCGSPLHPFVPQPVLPVCLLTICFASALPLLDGWSLVYNKGCPYTVHLYLVYHIPDITSQLLSMGTFLLDDLMVHDDIKSITFLWNTRKEFLWFELHLPRDSIYVVQSHTYEDTHGNPTIVYAVDYWTLHKHLAHPSCDVILHARKNTWNFLDVIFLKKDPICPGCTYGKMPNHTFSLNLVHAKEAFELIHLNLKSFPMNSYQKYKYLIIFIDNYTGFAWTLCMQTKSEFIKYMHDFITLVSMQHNSKVVNWMSDVGGEYKSNAFDVLLKQHGIKILQSAPHTPQQNSCTERFMCTMMDKAEAMCHKACILPSYWEFAI